MSNIVNMKESIQDHIDADEYETAISLIGSILDKFDLDVETQIWALRLRAHCYSWCAGMDDAASVEEEIPEQSEADEDVELALADLDRVLEIPSLSTTIRAEVLFERITELRWLGRFAEAKDDCCRILDTPSLELNDTINAYYTRADINLCLEDTGGAIDDLATILANENVLSSTKAETLEFRADVWAQAGEITKTLDDLQGAMDIFKSMEYACGIKRVAEKIYTYSSMV